MDKRRVVLITGASSGIGQACARRLHQRGYRVYGTSRQADSQALIPMDVTSDDSVRRGVEAILECEGRLDVVVNNAGFGLAGAVEDTTLVEAQAQFEVNFFGVVRVCRAVLPLMRHQSEARDRRGGGTIVNISSIGGLIGVPFQALYCASKHALEGLTEALRMEVRPYGIHVVLIEPGDLNTSFAANRQNVAAAGASAYADRARRAVSVMAADEMKGTPQDGVARLIGRVIASSSPRLRYMVGPPAERLAVTVKKLLPPRLFEWAIMKYYRVA